MANAAQFTIIISALDKATTTFRGINLSLNRNLVLPFANVGKSIAALAEETGLAQVGRDAANAGRRISDLGRSIGGLLGPLAALGAAASVAGLYELAKSAGEWGEQLELASQKTGVGVDALAKLHYAASRVNMPVEQMDKGLFSLNTVVQAAVTGHNKLAAAYFNAMHIALTAHGKLRDPLNIFLDIASAFAQNRNAQQQAGAAAVLFGKRMGAEFIPVLNLGTEAWKKFINQFERYYGKVTPELLKSLNEGHDAFEEMRAASDGLKLSLGAALLPAFQAIIAPITKFVALHRVEISNQVNKWGLEFAGWVKSVDWSRVGAAVRFLGGAISLVGGVLGPFWSTLALAGIAFSPLIASTLGASGALLKLSWHITKFIGLIVFGGLIESIATVVPMIGSMSDAFAAFDLVLDANPIALAVIGVAALAAVAYEVYENWDGLSDFFQNTWNEIVDAFQRGFKSIEPILRVLSYVPFVGASPALGAALYQIDKLGGDFSGLKIKKVGAGQIPNVTDAAVNSFVGGRLGAAIRPALTPLVGRGPTDGEVHVKVDFSNMPPGAKASARSTGSNPPRIDLNAGRAWSF
ncbi:MAG TPA: hypothetical protein VHC42_05415 [Rhizomicrobium sp.]|nr:hypothetical protein [Rhizomicrobium sp.]